MICTYSAAKWACRILIIYIENGRDRSLIAFTIDIDVESMRWSLCHEMSESGVALAVSKW